MPIGKAHVGRVADLARLKLTPQEHESFTKDLSQIVTYMDMLSEIDTGSVALSCDSTRSMQLRDDEPAASLSTRTALANAAKTKDGFFIVPRVL